MSRGALPAHLKARILETTKREAVPSRPTMLVNSALVLAIALAITVNLFFAAGGTRGDPRPRPLVLGTLLGWLTLAISSTWGALGRGGAMEGRPGRQLALLAGAIPTAASLWMGAWAARYYAVVASLPMGDNPRCFLLALGLSLPAFLGLALVRRDSEVKHPGGTGAALGGAGAAWGGTFLDAHCPSLDLAHLALGHLLPIAVLVLVGALLGQRLTRAKGIRFPM